MKFLCEQCKAKYQIDDAKVAGKTVRMKCRKCGHLIEVRAEVTETSVASALPKEGDETKIGAPDPAMLAAQKSAATPAPPRPGAAPLKPQGKLATSLASAKPQTRAPAPAPQQSALAGAFSKSVQKDDDALLELSTTAEWYVAINGVPVGPIRLSELRRKAASGAITEDSLCWQEGLEEWRPLKTVTELAAIVREAAASARPSLANPPQHEAPSSHTPAPSGQPSRPPGTPSPSRVGTPSPPRTEAKPGAMAARSNVVSLSSRLATAEKLHDPQMEPEEHTVISDPFAAIAPEPAPPVSAPMATDSSAAALPLTASAPVAPLGAATAPVGVATEAVPQKKGPNWIAIAMVVLAAAFGVTAAIAVFFRSSNTTPQVTTVYLSATTGTPTATATTTTLATADTTPTATTSASGTAIAAAGTVRPSGTGGAGGAAAGTAAATTTSTNNSSIAALLGGPATGPNVGGGTGGGTTGGGLSDKAVQDAVRNYTPGVKRTCWERGGSAESTAIVDVTVTVAPNGNVSNAVATGNDPLVAKCIENQVRNWRFAAPGEVTTIKIPFKFLKQ